MTTATPPADVPADKSASRSMPYSLSTGTRKSSPLSVGNNTAADRGYTPYTDVDGSVFWLLLGIGVAVFFFAIVIGMASFQDPRTTTSPRVIEASRSATATLPAEGEEQTEEREADVLGDE